MDAICVSGVSKRFGRVTALDSVSFTVPQRSITGLLGPNGAGKTTLFSVIAGFLKSDGGWAEVLGVDVRRGAQLQGRLSIFPQDAHFQRNVPILEQLVFFRRLGGRSREEALDEVMATLGMVGLETVAKRRVGTLSHGMVKRLGIAQAFLGHPEVILLDEPTAGLDPANARQIRELITTLQERATIIVSSHNLAEIQELCDHVVILDHGKLVLAAPVDAITRAGREYNVVLSRALVDGERERLVSLAGIRDVSATSKKAGPASYVVTLDLSADDADEDEVIGALLRGILDMQITPRRIGEGRSLETRFLEVTREKT